MPKIKVDALTEYRLTTFRTGTGLRLTSPEMASEFVARRGFVYFWPIKGIDLPSMWVAVAGDRPVPNEHDDPGHVTWGWKDNALGKDLWYYAKVLRRKATMISLDMTPNFYALSDNYGSPEEDHLPAYETGRMPLAAKLVYEALLAEGPLHTIELRRAARLTSNASSTEFARALELLQADFKVMPIGVAEAGAWRYAHIYDIPARFLPDLPDRARQIPEAEARQAICAAYFKSVGAAQLRDVQRLFGWVPAITRRCLNRLLERQVVTGCTHPDRPGEWFSLPDLCE